MPRLIATLCALMLLVGCASTPSSSTTPVSTPPQSAAPAASAAQESQSVSSSSGDLSVDKGLLDVTITIPADFGAPLSADFDADAYAKENGFKKVVVGEDGSLIITMSKAQHTEWMSEAREEIKEIFAGFVEADETPYIKSIEASSDFTSVAIHVEKQTYMESFDMTPFSIGFQVAFYQIFNGDEVSCNIIVKDFKNGEILNSVAFPDDMK